MIGSLQEFLGEINKQTFLSVGSEEKKFNKKQKRQIKARSLQKDNREAILQIKSAVENHMQAIKYERRSNNYHTLPQSSQRRSQKSSSGDKIANNSKLDGGRQMTGSCKWTEHVPQSKEYILKAFTRLRRNDDEENNSKILDKIRQNTWKASSKQTKNNSQMHLKGVLKHEHQLLRSIVRVQEEGLINPKTFLELSLQNLTDSFSQVKIKPLFRTNREVNSFIEQIKGESFETDDYPNTFIPQRLKKERKSSTTRSTHRILLENQHRWAKARAKSTKTYEQVLGIYEGKQSEEKLSRKRQQRKEMFKKIQQLMSGPRARRKSSIMTGSVYLK